MKKTIGLRVSDLVPRFSELDPWTRFIGIVPAQYGTRHVRNRDGSFASTTAILNPTRARLDMASTGSDLASIVSCIAVCSIDSAQSDSQGRESDNMGQR